MRKRSEIENPHFARLTRAFQSAFILAAISLNPNARLWAQSWISDHFPRLDWQPTWAPLGARYAGTKACAGCHDSEAASQPQTEMAHALSLPSDSSVLQEHPRMTFRLGRYTYQIIRRGKQSYFSVTDGTGTISVPILWAFGYSIGGVGQTYVFKYRGYLLESQVSYYEAIKGLDLTIGHSAKPAESLEVALGGWFEPPVERACFGCHATNSVSNLQIQPERMTPGITCEGCHGPGADHITQVKAGNFDNLRIFNPGHLSTGDMTDFCGSCHRTSLQTKLQGTHGVGNVRFQSYRLTRSRCYDPGDRRISCITCHDPHKSIEREPKSYDDKCLACHQPATITTPGDLPRGAKACPKAKSSCTTCHMPKIEIPGAHFTFSDHWIRIVMSPEAYPD